MLELLIRLALGTLLIALGLILGFVWYGFLLGTIIGLIVVLIFFRSLLWFPLEFVYMGICAYKKDGCE